MRRYVERARLSIGMRRPKSCRYWLSCLSADLSLAGANAKVGKFYDAILAFRNVKPEACGTSEGTVPGEVGWPPSGRGDGRTGRALGGLAVAGRFGLLGLGWLGPSVQDEESQGDDDHGGQEHPPGSGDGTHQLDDLVHRSSNSLPGGARGDHEDPPAMRSGGLYRDADTSPVANFVPRDAVIAADPRLFSGPSRGSS